MLQSAAATPGGSCFPHASECRNNGMTTRCLRNLPLTDPILPDLGHLRMRLQAASLRTRLSQCGTPRAAQPATGPSSTPRQATCCRWVIRQKEVFVSCTQGAANCRAAISSEPPAPCCRAALCCSRPTLPHMSTLDSRSCATAGCATAGCGKPPCVKPLWGKPLWT